MERMEVLMEVGMNWFMNLSFTTLLIWVWSNLVSLKVIPPESPFFGTIGIYWQTSLLNRLHLDVEPTQPLRRSHGNQPHKSRSSRIRRSRPQHFRHKHDSHSPQRSSFLTPRRSYCFRTSLLHYHCWWIYFPWIRILANFYHEQFDYYRFWNDFDLC